MQICPHVQFPPVLHPLHVGCSPLTRTFRCLSSDNNILSGSLLVLLSERHIYFQTETPHVKGFALCCRNYIIGVHRINQNGCYHSLWLCFRSDLTNSNLVWRIRFFPSITFRDYSYSVSAALKRTTRVPDRSLLVQKVCFFKIGSTPPREVV